jgi:hypothetical protein
MQDVSQTQPAPRDVTQCEAQYGYHEKAGIVKGNVRKQEMSTAESNPRYRTSERHADITEGKGREGITSNAS